MMGLNAEQLFSHDRLYSWQKGGSGLPGPEKQKKAKFGHNQFQKMPKFQIRKKGKYRPNFQGKFAKLYQINFVIS